MYIEINLSIEKSGGEENLPKVVEAVKEAVSGKFPDAEVIVRKGFFKTIDGVYSDDLYAEGEARQLLKIVRERVLKS